MTGRTVYSVATLKAMRSWHTLIEHFDGIDAAIKWVEQYRTMEWKPVESEWSKGLADPETLIEHLKEINVLGNYYWSTTLCGRTQVEGLCMDLAVQMIIKRWKTKATIFTIPSDVLRFPSFDSQWIKSYPVWEQLKTAASTMKLETEKLFFFGVIIYDLNHWCAVSVNLSRGDVRVYDPQQTGDRFKFLQTFLTAQVLPLLPQMKSPKRFRFQQIEWIPQLDNYNCGIFQDLDLILAGLWGLQLFVE
ncbi:hypothetical protein L915_01318 [Phytophthora nicotianae]|uniref:Ubiquitin-like protease family profile domain-containing protein n=1 Tax=Phytophthora nicotianae TaxID=4792 RepID=W2HKX3_PHYNI|nr:hypothetical protein L915_01318 [Phytophthora nicotianae]